MHFCEALGDIFDLTLHCRAQHDYLIDLHESYGIRKTFKIAQYWRNKYWTIFWMAITRSFGDFVYTRDLFCALIFLFASRRKKIIWESHVFNTRFRYRLAYSIMRLFFQNRMKVISITEALASQLRKYFLDISVFPDACRLRGFCVISRDVAEPTLGYVGSFHSGKGVDLVLKLAARLPEHRFLVVGGAEEQRLQLAKIAPTNVRFLGFLSQAELPSIYLDIDIALLPNQRNVVLAGSKFDIGPYTSPMKLFEYGGFALPIIASDLAVLREVLGEGDALFVDPDNLEGWVDAIATLKNRATRDEIGRSFHDKVVRNFTWEQRASRLEREILNFERPSKF